VFLHYVPLVPALLDKYIARLGAADRNTRLETLLNLSRRLPALPPALEEEKARGDHLVPECQTPVHLWVEVTGGGQRRSRRSPARAGTR